MLIAGRRFDHVTVVDFEYTATPGERPVPICCVTQEVGTGALRSYWVDDLVGRPCPYPTGLNDLVVTFNAVAEYSCHAVLGWPIPINSLDLMVEFKCLTNGLPRPMGAGLLGAAATFGLDVIEAAHKEAMRDLAKRGGPYDDGEKAELLEYCASDVKTTTALLLKMEPKIDLGRALLRGLYMGAVALIEHEGVPIDVPVLNLIRETRAQLRLRLPARIDTGRRIYAGTKFKAARWVDWVRSEGIPWPMLPSGQPRLDDATFEEMSRIYPQVRPYRELRQVMAQTRSDGLAVGRDGRNRTPLWPFSSRTSRNQPSTSAFIFGAPKWFRGLIKPPPGYGLAYLDFEQQEFGIAAYLSRDGRMIAAYQSGDPYIAFALQAGAVPPNATKASHPIERELFKECALGVQYGMAERRLALRIRRPPAYARELLALHHAMYPRFWSWAGAAVDTVMLGGVLQTVFGWGIRAGSYDHSKAAWRAVPVSSDIGGTPDADEGPNPRMLANFPMQANGGDMLRLSVLYAHAAGVRVVAPVHDALLIEVPLDQLDHHIALAKAAMLKASRDVLGGAELRVEVEVIRFPHRFMDDDGRPMWDAVRAEIASIRGDAAARIMEVECDDADD